jgi:hypothetical protein
MRDLTQEEISELEKFSHALMKISEMALIFQVEKMEFFKRITNCETEESKAYYRGKLRAKAEIQKAVVGAAAAGSTPAISQALQLSREQDNEILRDNETS